MASRSDQGFVSVAIAVLIASIGALWKIRTLKPDTYDRHERRVALGISSLEASAITVLLRLGSQSDQPTFIVGRTLDVDQVERHVAQLQDPLSKRRRLQSRFRRMLQSCIGLQSGVVAAAVGGALLILTEKVAMDFWPWRSPNPGLFLIIAGVLVAVISYSMLLYYESRMTDASYEGDFGE